jgi:8-amino-7-oxononanoate synthase
VVVADGFCPGCGRPAPVEEYLEAVRPLGGRLVLDDTQALGILGATPSSTAPYGYGGGGTLRRFGIPAPEVLLISSLAKGFGAPVAALAGDATTVRSFKANSVTRVHCSPPSVAAIHAGERALALNERCGDFLRRRLACLVRRFRAGLGSIGMASRGGFFPVQTLNIRRDARRLHASLLQQGIGTVLRQPEPGWNGRISFLITARHSPHDIDAAVEALARFRGSCTERRTRRETTYEACI